MGKQTEISEIVNQAIEDLVYKPTRRERELKAKLWVAIQDDPFLDKDSYLNSKEAAEKAAGGKLVNWNSPGYKEWLFNKDEHRQRLEYLFGLSLDAMEEILVNNDPKVQGARVQLIRALSELAGKVPHKQASIKAAGASALSSAIDSMDAAQLELYLRRSGVGELRVSASKEPSEIIDVTKDKR